MFYKNVIIKLYKSCIKGQVMLLLCVGVQTRLHLCVVGWLVCLFKSNVKRMQATTERWLLLLLQPL